MKTMITLLALSSCAYAGTVKSLVFGIDGLGYGEQGFDAAYTPFMDSLIAGTWAPGYRGAYSDQAFAGGVVGTPTEQSPVSGPGWATILSGVWVDRHHVADNTFVHPRLVDDVDFVNNPIYLGTLKDTDPSLVTASYVYWPPINSMIDTINLDANPLNDMDFNQSYKTRNGLYNENDTAVIAAAREGLSSDLNPDATFVSIFTVDAAGHGVLIPELPPGNDSPQYAIGIEQADAFVGELLTAIVERPQFEQEDWQIVIISDHGFTFTGGHQWQLKDSRTIPLIVSSQGLNPGFLEAGDGPPISHADVAPTVLDHFGIATPPHYWGASRAAGAVAIPEPSSVVLPLWSVSGFWLFLRGRFLRCD